MLMSVYCESADGSECKTHVVHDSERVRERPFQCTREWRERVEVSEEASDERWIESSWSVYGCVMVFVAIVSLCWMWRCDVQNSLSHTHSIHGDQRHNTCT